jgi:hypothetical protein
MINDRLKLLEYYITIFELPFYDDKYHSIVVRNMKKYAAESGNLEILLDWYAKMEMALWRSEFIKC